MAKPFTGHHVLRWSIRTCAVPQQKRASAIRPMPQPTTIISFGDSSNARRRRQFLYFKCISAWSITLPLLLILYWYWYILLLWFLMWVVIYDSAHISHASSWLRWASFLELTGYNIDEDDIITFFYSYLAHWLIPETFHFYFRLYWVILN